MPNSKQHHPTAKAGIAGTSIVKRLAPGSPGTRRLLERFGDALVCVRYRHDPKDNQRFTTVELVVESRPGKPEKLVWLRVGYGETALRQQVKLAGGIWNVERALWQLPLRNAKALGLEKRIVENVR